MDVSIENRRPYAAPSNVLAVLQRVRSRNLPDAVNDDFLRLAEVPVGAMGRVKEALAFLGLVHEDGRPTDLLAALAKSPDLEYRQLLEGAIRQAYAADLARIDPGEDSQAKIVDAFRPYEPRSQTARMVMLFLGLSREAGIQVLDLPRERKMQARATPRTQRLPAPNLRPRDVLPPGGHTLATVQPTELLFGVNESDIAALDDAEFQEVWTALGKVARARARAAHSKVDAKDIDKEVMP